ncbi:acyltransferase family protein [Jatrophihabitans sp.]|uniref:acyltransferase family protein n=1 Tax=Jatrophihabitans sp. TaxID=1932789 RepID=UPI0030C6F610
MLTRNGPTNGHPAPTTGSNSEHTGFRPDVQGLRALAVSLVVLYHLYPTLIPGGYIGVDVFFVISGFLITGLLARSVARTGKVGLLGFYGRRARRLLPAATLVLTVTWVVSRQVLPVTQLSDTATQIRASALYFQNWVLAGNSTNYLKSDNAATPVQHFWSLSVEEQFYLFWPLIFVIGGFVAYLATRRTIGRHASALTARQRHVIGRSVCLLLALAIIVASLRFSAHETVSNPSGAYFETSTRIWELGIGGLLALLPGRVAYRLGRVGVLAWIGLAMVLVSAFTISGTSSFPGTIALWPVLGAAAVLACGSSSAKLGTARVMSRRPLVVIGDLSYGIYLWHWPIIVLWQAYYGSGIGYFDGPTIIAASVLLSYLTKRLVEDPIRSARFLRSTGRSLAVVALAIVPVTLATVFLINQPGASSGTIDASHPGAAALAAPAASSSPAAAKSATATTPDKVADAKIIPSLATVGSDYEVASLPNCKTSQTGTTPTICTFGDTATPTKTVALIGDSHAAQWSSDLDTIGKAEHWKIVVETKDSCTFGATTTTLNGSSSPYSSCVTWDKNVMTDLLTKIHPDVVIVSERADSGTTTNPKIDATAMAEIGKGMADYWTQLISHGMKVVAIHETPEPGKNIPDCLAERDATISGCAVSASSAVTKDTPTDVASTLMKGAVPVIDMTSHICTTTTCPAVVGNVIVYRDNQHLSQTYTESIEPYLKSALLKTAALSTST